MVIESPWKRIFIWIEATNRKPNRFQTARKVKISLSVLFNELKRMGTPLRGSQGCGLLESAGKMKLVVETAFGSDFFEGHCAIFKEFAGEGDGSWLVDVIQRDDRRTGDEAGEIQCMGGTDVADSDNANT